MDAVVVAMLGAFNLAVIGLLGTALFQLRSKIDDLGRETFSKIDNLGREIADLRTEVAELRAEFRAHMQVHH